MPTYKLDDGTEVTTTVSFACAFCGGQAHVATEPPCVVHDEPRCPGFEVMEACDFLTACREAAQRRASARQAVA